MTNGTENNGMSITTIKILPETRDRLREMGKKSESYDDVIQRLIAFYEKKGDE